jgi:hypothetical protein
MAVAQLLAKGMGLRSSDFKQFELSGCFATGQEGSLDFEIRHHRSKSFGRLRAAIGEN